MPRLFFPSSACSPPLCITHAPTLSPLGVWSTPASAPTDSLLASPTALLAYRATALAFTVAVGAAQAGRLGPRVLSYYTVWSWTLLTFYFGLGTLLSARRVLRGRVGAWADGSVDVPGAALVGALHVALPAALIVVALTWGLLVPMLLSSPDAGVRAHTRAMFFNWTSYAQHGANAGLALGELALNAIPLHSYLLGLLGAYSSLYGIWAFTFFRATGRWLYPFLNAHRPWAFAAYAGLYAAHFAFFGLAAAAWRARDALAARWTGRTIELVDGEWGGGDGEVVVEEEEEVVTAAGDKKED
jgi:hypothetical protein